MLTPVLLSEYLCEYDIQWAVEMPENCPPEEVLVADNHEFFRLVRKADAYDETDFLSYSQLNPDKDWGEMLPLAVGLSLFDNEQKMRKRAKLPFFKQFQGAVRMFLNPNDGVEKQTGVHKSHYTWWRTTDFDMSNLQLLVL